MATLLKRPAVLDKGESIDAVVQATERLHGDFAEVMLVDERLTRSLVSFQANKQVRRFRWYKFKEAFSSALVHRLLDEYGLSNGRLLDPFAGSGTALFASAERGLHADGIELLPVGQAIIDAQKAAIEHRALISDALSAWISDTPWRSSPRRQSLTELRITTGAFPAATHQSIECYLHALSSEPPPARTVLLFALLCAAESMSYTRKDGQYLRWDWRSGRRRGKKPFDKGYIAPFDQAILGKLREIRDDLLSGDTRRVGDVRVFRGSCLDILPVMPDQEYDLVITSPPYCNRYDYTRTYAIDLALLAIGEDEVARLRQEMLSCTVENRPKGLNELNAMWEHPIELASEHPVLSRINDYLEAMRAIGQLNNTGIPRMVRGYFSEMACVIAELARVLKPSGRVFMVNDNVRYAGAPIPVDLVLSDFARSLGFVVEEIRVLPGSKGNSSQQMGRYDREPLRKCIYVWRRP